MPAEKANLTPTLNVELQAFKESVGTQFAAINEATKLVREEYTRVPTQVDRATNSLRDLVNAQIGQIKAEWSTIEQSVEQLKAFHGEKFSSIETQFRLIAEKTRDSATDGKTAIEAALKSIQESMKKTEDAFDRSIRDLNLLVSTKNTAMEKLFDGLKERVVAMESSRKGGNELWIILGGIMGLVLLGVEVVSVMLHAK